MSKILYENEILYPKKLSGIYVEVLRRNLSSYSDESSENLTEEGFIQIPRIMLEDYSDALGRLKFDYYVSPLGYAKPYLYQVFNSANKFYILGTMHCLSLNILPPKILDLILKSSALVVERNDQDEQEESAHVQIINEVNEPAEWFEDYLSPMVQKHIFWAFSNMNISKEYLLKIIQQGPYNLGMAYQHEIGALYDPTRSMDRELINNFNSQNKTIIGLETFSEAFECDEYEADEYSKKTEEEVAIELNMDMENIIIKGGDQMMYMEYATQYINHKIEYLDDDPYVAKRN